MAAGIDKHLREKTFLAARIPNVPDRTNKKAKTSAHLHSAFSRLYLCRKKHQMESPLEDALIDMTQAMNHWGRTITGDATVVIFLESPGSCGFVLKINCSDLWSISTICPHDRNNIYSIGKKEQSDETTLVHAMKQHQQQQQQQFPNLHLNSLTLLVVASPNVLIPQF